MNKKLQIPLWVWKTMKISSLQLALFALCCGIAHAHKTKGQNVLERNISLQAEDLRFLKVLSLIEEQANVRFIYSPDAIDIRRKVTIKVTNKKLENVLKEVLLPLAVDFSVVDDRILLKRAIPQPPSMKVRDPDTSVVPEDADRTIRGKVTDEKGEALPGVNILVRGKQRGIVTNANGEFSIEVPDENAVLVFSFVGYFSKEIVVGNRSVLDISMTVDNKALEEVVVIGYGTINKSDLTGSVATLKMDGSEELPITSVEQMLQGRVSGVQITQNTGAPGGGISFLVRGANSVSGTNEPLIVLDGYPIESGNSIPNQGYSDAFADTPGNNTLANLNPNDIESVEILKDASATAIYGSRGANGVVLITTKRGKAGRERIEYNFRFDLSQVPRKIPVLNTTEYLAYANEAAANANQNPVYNDNQIAELSKVDFDWQDLIYRTAKTQNHQLNISGGDDRMRYTIATNYLTQQGVVQNSNFERGSVRANLDRQVNRKLKVGMNFNGSLSQNRSLPQSTQNGNIGGSVVLGALMSRPMRQPYSIDDDDEVDLTYSGNPLTLIRLFKDRTRERAILVNMFADFEIVRGLKFRINGGVNDRATTRQNYSPRGTYSGDVFQGQAFRGENSSFNYLTEYTLNYNKAILGGKHRLNAVAGYTWQKWTAQRFGVVVREFPNDNLTYYNLQSGNTIGRPNSATQQWALASWLGRVNYSIDNRYLITFTGRTDGSSRLSESNRWDFFPSVALGWNLHNERFLKELPLLSELKLRASYGISGSQSIGVGSTNAILNIETAVIGQSVLIGYNQGSMANNRLGWETTTQLNIGTDIGVFNDRLKIGFDIYKKRSRDLLLNLPIPPSTGLSNYATNVGEIENKGLELDISGAISTGNIKWDASGNISFNRNRVISLGDLSEIRGGAFSVNSQLNRSLHVTKPGSPIGSFFGHTIIGVYQTQEEVDAGPTDPVRPTPGDYRYADIGGPDGVPDGLISEYDVSVIGNPNPDFFFGINNDLSWNKLSLTFLLQGSIGQDIINLNRHQLDGLSGSPTQSRKEAWENRWTGPGSSNTYAKATLTGTNFQNRFTNFIVEDGSYVRLKNLIIGYELPVKKVEFIRTFKLFLSATNLITFTKYTGYDPEINSKGQNATTPGVDYGSIPQMKVYSMGINAAF